jgi:hypothetical protein
MPRILAAVIFSCLLAGKELHAQQQVQGGESALQLSLAALSASSSSSVEDATLTGNGRRVAGSTDENGTFTLRMLDSSGSRGDYSYPSGTMSEVRSYTARAGQWIGADGTAHALASHNLFTEGAWFFPLTVIRHSLDTTHYQTTFVGAETLDGEAVQHFRYTRTSSGSPATVAEIQDLSRTEIYLDAMTHLPVRITFNDHPDRDARTSIPMEIRYSSYQPINGTQVPFEIQQYRNHALSLDLQVENAVLNTNIAASLFNLQ